MNIIVIDCGASFIKAAKFCEGTMLCQVQRKAPEVSNNRKQRWITELIPLIRDILMKLTIDETEVALGISNEMHGFLLAYEDGEPFTDYISWQKEYGSILVDNLSSQKLLEDSAGCTNVHNTGMPLRAGLPSCNLLYLSRTGVLSRAKASIIFYTLGDYILRALSGKDPSIHPTNAAATGLFDLVSGSWSCTMIESAGGRRIRFLPVGTNELIFRIGKTTVHAYPAIGDQQAALLGAGLQDEHTLSFNLGTGAQVSVLVSAFEKTHGFQIRPYFGNQYLKTIPHIPSGRALNVFVRFFYDILAQFGVLIDEERLWQCLLCAEKSANETEMVCDMSFFENAVTGRSRGALSNIGEFDLTLANLMNKIFRQLADNFISCADVIVPDTSQIRKILFSGGVARKIERIRGYILNYYAQGTSVVVAKNETLIGLHTYINQCLKDAKG